MVGYTNFETLIKKNNLKSKDKWYPNSIDNYRGCLKIGNDVQNGTTLCSNIAYNLQYIEFLELSFEELSLSDVLYTMMVKNYVIVGMSILEAIFSYLLRKNSLWKTTDLKSIGTTQANPTNFEDNEYIIKTEIFIKVEQTDVQMNLDEMIKILSRHHETLKINHTIYPALRRLKELRNRVHLQKIQYEKDHDYNAFDWKTKKEMGAILYGILTSDAVSISPNNFEFLKVNLETTP